MMWRFSASLDDPEVDTVIEKPDADVWYSAVKSFMHSI
jgi:hypothetical protein